MQHLDKLKALLFVLLVTTGCSSSFSKLETTPGTESAQQAQRLLEASIEAHGGDLYAEVSDIAVSYQGDWGKVIRRIQPVLTDVGHRKASEERLILADGILAQEHRGPAGRKWVLRHGDAVTVGFSGEGRGEADEEERAAAALVADVYEMFLTGPSYFRHREAELWQLPPAREKGRVYDRLVAVLEPGFGFSEQDRAILWLDRETKRLFRTQFSIEGLESTRGAEVDTTYRNYREVGGYLWPTDFLERVRAPLRVKAHHWWMTGLDLNRGLTSEDLTSESFSERAAEPAAALD